jgi:hypothetical protein
LHICQAEVEVEVARRPDVLWKEHFIQFTSTPTPRGSDHPTTRLPLHQHATDDYLDFPRTSRSRYSTKRSIISIPESPRIQSLAHQSTALRQELKEWEKSFAEANGGRKAGRNDIKQDVVIGIAGRTIDATYVLTALQLPNTRHTTAFASKYRRASTRPCLLRPLNHEISNRNNDPP